MRKSSARPAVSAAASSGFSSPARSRMAFWTSMAAAAVGIAWMLTKPPIARTRRYADRDQERRNPLHFFLAGRHPGRRRIDRSGRRPLFERRQSVYDNY